MTTKLSTENQVDIWYGTENDSSNLILGVENIGTSSLLFFDGQTLTKLDIEDGINHVSLDIQTESWGFILFNDDEQFDDEEQLVYSYVHILDSELPQEEEEGEELKGTGGATGSATGKRNPPAGATGSATGKRSLSISPIRFVFPPAPRRPSPRQTAGTGKRSLSNTSFVVINNLTNEGRS